MITDSKLFLKAIERGEPPLESFRPIAISMRGELQQEKQRDSCMFPPPGRSYRFTLQKPSLQGPIRRSVLN